MDPRTSTGRTGEDATERHYVARGFRVLARNWRCRVGELDLVLAQGPLLVFCEVKTRTGSRFGGGWQAVDPRKQAKLRALGEAFLVASRLRPRSVRFDVASVQLSRAGTVRVHVFEDAF
jgi:putative endonuclease